MHAFPDLSFKEICALFERNDLTDALCTLLKQSLFCYCCGQNPAPVAAFGGGYPLYVYADNPSGIDDFEGALRRLYKRLNEAKFLLKMGCTPNRIGRIACAENAEITLWRTPKKEYFLLLCIQCDAADAFKSLYGENPQELLPNCICNHGCEMDTSFFLPIEKRVQYILGHCHDDGYRRIGEYDDLGECADREQKAALYQRIPPAVC